MTNANRKILILEDDQALGEALVSALSKIGLSALLTSRPEDAREYLRNYRVVAIVADCLLPTENGVDFIQSIRHEYPKERLDVLLMSGIFTDASFVKESLRSTSAVAFLKKPFQMEEFLSHFQSFIPVKSSQIKFDKSVNPRRVLYQLFGRPSATDREKRKAIEALEDIHGFDLPLIYNILVRSRLSGHLNIVSDLGEVSGISFSEGEIVGVDTADKETYLGKLLIESGYLLPEDLEIALNIKSNKRLGEKLIQSNLLSPHGFEAVLANQMSLRLSRTITDQNVKINFVVAEVEKIQPVIDADLFEAFLHDWIASKITLDWFRAHYVQWSGVRLIYRAGDESTLSALKKPLVVSLEKLVEVATSGLSIGEIIDQKKFPEHTFYKAIHFLLTLGIFILKDESSLNPDERAKVLKKMLMQMNGRNKLEVFDVLVKMTGVSTLNPDRVAVEFLRFIGGVQPSDSPEVQKIISKLQQFAEEACEFARSGGRDRMREEMMKNEVEIKLKASSLFDSARGLLQKSQHREALTMLQKVVSMDPKLDKLTLYLVWAKLGSLDSSTKSTVLKEIEFDLLQIPPEEKFDSLYNFVIGLFAKAKGDQASARKSFEKAVAMDNSMIVARRELTVLTSLNTGKTDLLNSDLKSLVGSLFKKSR